MTTRKPPKGAPCSIEGCEKVVDSKGWCSMHYYRNIRHGNPTTKLYRDDGLFETITIHKETYDALMKIKKGTFDETIRSLLPS